MRLLVLGIACCLPACSLERIATHQSARSISTGNCGSAAGSAKRIAVISHGWHTGIAIAVADLDSQLGQLLPAESQVGWVEFGWGDREFYQASGYSYWLALKAVVASSGAVLHVALVNSALEQSFPHSDIVYLQVSQVGLQQLSKFIIEHATHGGTESIRKLGTGLYGTSAFYHSAGAFSLFHTCNSWTAQALLSAGCSIDADLTRASSLMAQLSSELHQPRE